MITKFKIFENKNDKYSVGDIVLVNSEYNEIYNEVMRISYVSNLDRISYEAEFFNDPESLKYFIIHDDIIRKLEPHEIDAIKYNL